MNLTGITEWEEVVVKHFIDSLAVVKACDMNRIKNLIDIGTGAGFPGIPLKIAFPDMECVLLDSLAKRVKFLDEVILNLKLTGIRSVHGRAEDYARQKDYRNHLVCVCRGRLQAFMYFLNTVFRLWRKEDSLFRTNRERWMKKSGYRREL